MEIERVTPVILTCGLRIDYIRTFVTSWRKVETLPAPVVLLDITSGPELGLEYVDEIASLRPRVIIIHPRVPNVCAGDSVQDAGYFALEQGLKHRRAEETHLLFFEDDVLLSSRFVEGLRSCDPSPDLGYTTLYQPWDGYGSAGPVSSETVHSGYFYGAQCILFPHASAALLVENRDEIDRRYPPCYDLRWSRFLADRGRPIHTTERSYVQHIGVESRFGSMTHQSNVFVE